MVDNLFKFLEKNDAVLSEDLKNTITESFNIALKEKTDSFDSSLKESEKQLTEAKVLLKEAANEITALRTKKVAEVEKAVKVFEENLVNKLDKYLEFKLKDSIPQTLLEAVAKVEVYEPLVESIKKTFETKGIKIDDKGYEVLKEAKTEIVESRKKYDTLLADKLKLEEASEKLLGKYLLNEKCIGLTEAQTKKVKSLLNEVSFDEIEKRFDTIRKIVINEEKKESNPSNKSNKVTEEIVSKEGVILEDYGQRLI